MSKADNKELEEAIKTMQHWIEYEKNNKSIMINADELLEMETIVLNELLRLQEETIEKDKIREKIEERKFKLQQEYRNFEDDIKLNILKELLEGK